MNSNVTGSSSDPFSPTTSLPDNKSTSPLENEASSHAATTTLPSDVQVFEGTDFMNSSDIIIQQFATVQQSRIQGSYQASTQIPILQIPDPDGQTGPQPFEPSWQKAVNKFFRDQLRIVLINKAKESGDADALHKEKTKETAGESETKDSADRGMGGLGGSPERKAKEILEEGEPTLPLPQIETHLNGIIQTIAAGKGETLSKDDEKLVAEATNQTQKSWKLPASWSVGTEEIRDWTPISTNVVAPVNIEISRREFIANNLEEILKALDKAAQKTTNALPPNDPQRIGIADLIKVIARAIQDLKAVLQDMQLQDYEVSSKLSKGKFDAIKDREKEMDDIANKMQAILNTRMEQEKISKIMKLVAPIVSAVIIIAGVIALPFTAGASTALIIAGIAVASVMLAYTIADSFLDITSKAVQGFNTWLEEAFPGDQAWKATLIKIAVIAALAIILVVAVAATGGGAAANVASATTAQIVKQAVLETIRQLAIQFSIIAIMSSNILPDLFVQALINSGAIDKNDEQAKMIIKMVIMILTMITMMFAVAKGMKSGGAEKAVAEEAKSIEQAAKLSDRIKQTLQEGINAVKELIDDGIQFLKSAPRNLKETGKEFLQNFSPKHILEGFKSFNKGDIGDLPSKIQDILRMLNLSVEIGMGIYVAYLGFELAKVYEEMGELQKAEELTKMLIKLLDQLLASFQENINQQSEWLAGLDGALNSLYSSAQQTIHKATQLSI